MIHFVKLKSHPANNKHTYTLPHYLFFFKKCFVKFNKIWYEMTKYVNAN